MSKAGTFKAGHDPRRNLGGQPQATRDLRKALEGDGPEIHDALMSLVRDGNAPAIIYAHTQLLGKPRERVDVRDERAAASWIAQLTPAQVLAIARGDTTEEDKGKGE